MTTTCRFDYELTLVFYFYFCRFACSIKYRNFRVSYYVNDIVELRWDTDINIIRYVIEQRDAMSNNGQWMMCGTVPGSRDSFMERVGAGKMSEFRLSAETEHGIREQSIVTFENGAATGKCHLMQPSKSVYLLCGALFSYVYF